MDVWIYDVWMLRLSDGKAQPFLRSKLWAATPRFSPDGRWLAYISDESGGYEVYVQPYPGPGVRVQISQGGGTEPVWNPNGRELFYRYQGFSSQSKMMAVEYCTEPSFTTGNPLMLFEGVYLGLTSEEVPTYDVSADGQRFLMVKAPPRVTRGVTGGTLGALIVSSICSCIFRPTAQIACCRQVLISRPRGKYSPVVAEETNRFLTASCCRSGSRRYSRFGLKSLFSPLPLDSWMVASLDRNAPSLQRTQPEHHGRNEWNDDHHAPREGIGRAHFFIKSLTALLSLTKSR